MEQEDDAGTPPPRDAESWHAHGEAHTCIICVLLAALACSLLVGPRLLTLLLLGATAVDLAVACATVAYYAWRALTRCVQPAALAV